MSVLWRAAQAELATGGQAHGGWSATGVSIDTRTLAPGDLFVALTDQRDGHDFVAQALEKGAAAAMVSRIPAELPENAPLLVVDDVLEALEALARSARARSSARVVAVTGSVGKTSTKEMLRTVLAGQGKVHAAEMSFNNHWGVPLTLARLPEDVDFAVIEIGMNHPGEIAPLARMARPHVALVTTVVSAHLEAFDSIEAIASEKAAIFEGLEPGGAAVVNTDLPVSAILLSAAREHGAEVIRFGTAGGLELTLAKALASADATIVQAVHRGAPFLFKLMTPGNHFAMNALGALGVVDALGGDFALAAADLARWQPPFGRGRREIVVLDDAEEGLSLTLIDDAYNANPASMAAAFEVLAASPGAEGTGAVARRVAILGDMLELGSEEVREHRALNDHPALAKVDIVHCVGPLMRGLFEALPEYRRGLWCDSAEELAARAHSLVEAGDTILVKGSKGSKVSLLVDAIRKLGHPVAQEPQGQN